MAHPSGVEPNGNTNKHNENPACGHKKGHTNCVVADSSLQKVITAWPSLPPPLKAAVLAIVWTVCGEGGGHERE